MKKSLCLILVAAFGAAVSGVAGLLRALLLPGQESTLYLLGVTGGALLLVLASLAALRFSGPDLYLTYRRHFTASPSGAFLLWFALGLGFGIPRIEVQDFVFDAICFLCFALVFGAVAAVVVALRRPRVP